MEDLTDNESEELLRRWWSDNWLWLVGGIVIGLGGLAGWQYWQKSKLDASVADAGTYKAEIDSLGANQFDAASAKAKELRDLHPTSPYADQADLALARAAVERNDLPEAAKRLKLVADGSRDPQLRQIAKARLARVLVEQGKHDEALAQLDVATRRLVRRALPRAARRRARGEGRRGRRPAGVRRRTGRHADRARHRQGVCRTEARRTRLVRNSGGFEAGRPRAAPATQPGAAQ